MSFATHEMLDGVDTTPTRTANPYGQEVYPGYTNSTINTFSTSGDKSFIDYKTGISFDSAVPRGPDSTEATTRSMNFGKGSNVTMDIVEPDKLQHFLAMQKEQQVMEANNTVTNEAPVAKTDSHDLAKSLASNLFNSVPPMPTKAKSGKFSQNTTEPDSSKISHRVKTLERKVGELHEGMLHHTSVLQGNKNTINLQHEGLLNHTEALNNFKEKMSLQHDGLLNHTEALKQHHDGLLNHTEALYQQRTQLQLQHQGLEHHTSVLKQTHRGLLDQKTAMESYSHNIRSNLKDLAHNQYKVNTRMAEMHEGLKQHQTYIVNSKKPTATASAIEITTKPKLRKNRSKSVAAAPATYVGQEEVDKLYAEMRRM